MAQFTKVASTADLAPGEAKCVEVAGKKLGLFNAEGSFYAIDDTGLGLRAAPRQWFAGAAVSVPAVTGFVLLGAAVILWRSVLDVAGQARRRLSSLRASQRDQETSTPRAA